METNGERSIGLDSIDASKSHFADSFLRRGAFFGFELIGAVLVGAGVWQTAGFLIGTSDVRGLRGTLASISWSGIFGAPPIALPIRELRDVVARAWDSGAHGLMGAASSQPPRSARRRSSCGGVARSTGAASLFCGVSRNAQRLRSHQTSMAASKSAEIGRPERKPLDGCAPLHRTSWEGVLGTSLGRVLADRKALAQHFSRDRVALAHYRSRERR